MKRHGNLFDSILSFPNLLAASRKARRGKRFKPSTSKFEFNLEKELLQLQEELKNQTYIPGPYREFLIYEPKPRKISAALYRDRVVQHAICQIVEPFFDNSLIFDTYACRTGKGTHKAVDRFTQYTRKFAYALKCDVKKYFPSIDHSILKNKIRKKIKCPRTLWLIDLIIDSSNPQEETNSYFHGDDLFTPCKRRKGIPIGNLTSQIFANYFLSEADHFIKGKFPEFGYLRYMDDLTLFWHEKEPLWEVLENIQIFLLRDRLLLKPEKSMAYPVEKGVDYLGYKIFPGHRKVRYENVIRYRRRLKEMQGKYSGGKIGLKDINASVQSWIGHVKHADSWRLRESLFHSISFQRGGA